MTTSEVAIRRGPRTDKGKAAIRHNALKHGLWARDIVLSFEDPQAFEAHLSAYRAYLAPVGPLETDLVDRMVVSLWRLRRALRVETAAMDKTYQEVLPIAKDLFTPEQRRQRALLASINNEWIDNIHRYETTIERQFYRALHELENLQASRGATGLSLPPGALHFSLALRPPAETLPDACSQE